MPLGLESLDHQGLAASDDRRHRSWGLGSKAWVYGSSCSGLAVWLPLVSVLVIAETDPQAIELT